MSRSHRGAGPMLLALAVFIFNEQPSHATDFRLRLIEDINPTGSAFPLELTGFGPELYFTATGPSSTGRELYKTDGIDATLVANIHPSGSAFPTSGATVGGAFQPFEDEIYFRAANETGVGTYKSDGVSATRISDIDPVGLGNGRAFVLEDELYFQGRTGDNDTELFKTDGDSVSLVANINSAGSSHPEDFIALGSTVLFKATGANGRELHKLAGGIVAEVGDINPTGGSNPSPALVFHNELYFVAESTENDRELFKTDGATVTPLPQINLTGSASPREFNVLGDELFFTAQADVGHRQLFKTDGVNVAPVPLAAANSGLSVGAPIVLNDKLYFAADGPQGRELYQSDGDSIVLLEDLNAVGSSNPEVFFEYNAELYFIAQPTGSTRRLYKTDGTTVTEFSEITTSLTARLGDFTISNGSLYFLAENPSLSLYRTDGSTITEIVDVAARHIPDEYGETFYAYNDQLYFVLNGTAGRELYTVVPIPEPATAWLVAVGILVVQSLRRSRSPGLLLAGSPRTG